MMSLSNIWPKGSPFRAVRVKGGRLFSTLSVSDPNGRFHIECEKHPGTAIEIRSNDVMLRDDYSIEEAAAQALESCPGCLHEQAHKTTRWPNAGEPGGAEL